MRLQEFARGPASLRAQHGEKFPFRIELRGGAELRQHVGHDPVGPHLRPARALAVAGVGDLA